ncbi:MAG: MarR family transcriptional regulator [Actinomycetes bacterium]
MSTTDEQTVSSTTASVTARAGYMMGEAVEQSWSPDDALAWEGLLEVSRRLRRGAEALLEERHELSVSMLAIMGRLAAAPCSTLHQTDVADAMGLSLSRISRLIDTLEAREFVRRHPCPADARATNIELTPTGAERTAQSQETIRSYVQTRFVEQLSADERATLAAVFSRLLGDRHGADAGSCC